MNELKRKLVVNESLDEPMKKSRNQSISCLEDFSNEIFYDIFDYFHGGEMVQTFSNLNSRFEQLLYSSSFLIKTHFYLFNLDKMMNRSIELEISSTKICLNLKILSITASNDLKYLDAYLWERLILYYYPQLEKFYLTYSQRKNKCMTYSIYFGLNKFSSSFWIQRRWALKTVIDSTDIKYMIYPYRKTWYDNIENENIEYSISTSTSIILINSYKLYDAMIKTEFNRVLIFTQIYHLNIVVKHIPFIFLVQIRSLLPDLLTLKVHSLVSDRNGEFRRKEWRSYYSKQNKSRIETVGVEEINDMKIIDLLLSFCVFMKSLKIKHIINMNIEMFLRTILNQINDSSHDYLRSLTFHIPIVDDESITKFDNMIRSEKLLFNYTIKRVCEKINLQWK